jgi:DNA repair exonuclease SbcCD ATPase subunit
MKLLNLTPDNFKGIKHFVLEPNGSSIDVFGDNATGKTTLADAYFWLLFGKDSTGKTDGGANGFDVKTRGTSGLDYSVTGTFLGNDGNTFTLKRVYREDWRRKNGEAEKEFKGNTTDFFINDVPKPKKDFTAFVAGICDEKLFALLTDPDMFAGKMKGDERRAILISQFAPDVDDREIINAHDELKPLLNYIGYKSVDDYAEITKAQRQKINKQINEIPGRIDEAEKAKPFDIPTADDGPELLRLSKTRMKIESALEKIRNGESASALRKKISDIQADISQAKAGYLRKTAGGNNALDAEAATLRVSINKLRNAIANGRASIDSASEMVAGLTQELTELREKCVSTYNMTFDVTDNKCPTCGQEYPPEKQQEFLDTFNENKANQLEQLEVSGKSMKSTKENLEKDIEFQKQQLQADEQSLQHSTARLEELTKLYVAPPAFETTADYKKLQDNLFAAEHDLATVDKAAANQSEKFKTQLSDINGSIDAIKQRMTAKSIVEQQDKRIAELKAQEIELSQLLANYDNGLLLAEKFVQTKAQDIEEKVNSAFRLVRWKLFDKQVNGGIKACCEATTDQYTIDKVLGLKSSAEPLEKGAYGDSYSTNANSAARMNAGLDIINTLGRAAGVSVPIFMDNAEGVQRFIDVDAQLIQTIVPLSYDKLGKVVQDALIRQYGSEELARTAYEAPNKQLRAEVR